MQPGCVAFPPAQHTNSILQMQYANGGGDCGNSSSMLLNPPNSHRNMSLGYPSSSMSLSRSNMTGECSTSDYQDCGLSPMLLSVESPWDPNLDSSSPQARYKAKMRYNEKKKTRMYTSQLLHSEITHRICRNFMYTIRSAD